MGSLSVPPVSTSTGCCSSLHLSEDNARFVLLAVVLLIYMLAGAALFQFLEEETELQMVENFWQVYGNFQQRLLNDSSNLDMDTVHELLYAYGNASAAGLIDKRRRWDFPGSFHFVGTIVSTIGYGSTTPHTDIGKLVVILYGFLGCSGGILFFNLFLERIITFLAYALRSFHVRKLSKRVHEANGGPGGNARCVSNASLDEDEDSLDSWKPSVYWVMLYLTIASAVIATSASALYSPFEQWSFLESLYFCFVSFATIGFGDYVSTQGPYYPFVHWYRFGNFLLLVAGCCCTYSLFNVTSIVIKQALNWLIVKLDFRCERAAGEVNRIWRRQSQRIRRRRKSIAKPGNLRRQRRNQSHNTALRHGSLHDGSITSPNTGDTGDSDSVYDSDNERRLSGEMISMKDFLQANKVSLAVMQKQLYETAQMQRWGVSAQPIRPNSGGFTPGTVGPLAIVSQKLGENNA